MMLRRCPFNFLMRVNYWCVQQGGRAYAVKVVPSSFCRYIEGLNQIHIPFARISFLIYLIVLSFSFPTLSVKVYAVTGQLESCGPYVFYLSQRWTEGYHRKAPQICKRDKRHTWLGNQAVEYIGKPIYTIRTFIFETAKTYVVEAQTA